MNKTIIIHPGEILEKEYLIPANISAKKLAKSIGVSSSRIRNIIKKRQGITADTAIRLSKLFGNTPELWMNLQSAYDLKIAWAKNEEEYNRKNRFDFSSSSDFDQAKVSAKILNRYGEKLTFSERVYLLFQQIWETGMEYPILLQSKQKINLDAFEWYDDIIKIPKYKNELTFEEKKMLLKLNKVEVYKKIMAEANERETQDYYENTELADIDVDIIDESGTSKSKPREGWDEQFKKAKKSGLDEEEGDDF